MSRIPFNHQVHGWSKAVTNKKDSSRWSPSDRNDGDMKARKEQETFRTKAIASLSQEVATKHQAGRQSDAERMKAIFG